MRIVGVVVGEEGVVVGGKIGEGYYDFVVSVGYSWSDGDVVVGEFLVIGGVF